MSIKLADLKAIRPHGKALADEARPLVGDRPLLMFSAGKDGVAAALYLLEHFGDCVPVATYFVPGLEFWDDAIAYYERHLFKRKIHVCPHPSFWKLQRSFVYQTPRRAAIIAAADLPTPEFDDILALVKEQEGLAPDLYAAEGTRAAENMSRGVLIKNKGPIIHHTKRWWPIWELSKAEVLDMLKRHDMPLSWEYDFLPSSFTGLHYQYVERIRRHSPADYQRILDWYPLYEAESFRYEIARNRKG